MTADEIVAMVNDRRPPVVRTFHGRALAWDNDEQALTLAFRIEPPYANNANAVQGGIVTTLLDAAMGISIAASRGDMHNVPTLDINVRFLRPTPLGELTCVGRIVRAGRRIAYTSSILYAPDGKATADSTATSLMPETR